MEGQVLVLYSDFGFQKQKLVSSMPRLYKLRDAIEELFNSSLCLHIKYIPLLLLTVTCKHMTSLWYLVWTKMILFLFLLILCSQETKLQEG